MLKSPIAYALRALSTFRPPQKPLLFFGADSTRQLAELMVVSGHKRPLLVTDSFLLEHGMVDDLISYLKSEGCTVTLFDEIIPNPTFAVVEAGLKASLDNDCDSVIVVGGGSAIDAAKVIAAASSNPSSIEDLVGILKVKTPPLPFYVIPTTSGTGSEVTTAAVISDSETHKKKFFVDPKYIPLATALDPNLLKSLPPGMTAATGMDALTHAIEAYTSLNNFEDTDRDAALAIKLIFEYLPIAYENGEDLKAREMVALASFLAGYAFTKASLGYVHAISHQVSAHYDTPHGLANAVLLPRVMRFNKETCVERFAALEAAMGETAVDEGSGGVDANVLADRFIARVDRLAEQTGIPLDLIDLREKDFPKIARDALAEARSSYAVPRKMRHRDVEAILSATMAGERNVTFA